MGHDALGIPEEARRLRDSLQEVCHEEADEGQSLCARIHEAPLQHSHPHHL